MDSKRCARYAVIALATMALLLTTGTQCATDARRSLVAGSLDFVQGSAEAALQAIFPIEEMINGRLQPPA